MPSPESFILRLGGDGTGVLQVQSRVWGYSQPPIPVNLVVQSSAPGATVLTSTSGPDFKNLQVDLTLTEVSSTLQGTVHYGVNDSLGTRVVNDGRILFASPDSTVYLGAFQGDWVGYVTSQCTGDCSEDPIVLPYGVLKLSLSQAGSGISGALNGWVPVSGSVAGNTLNASVHYRIESSVCRPGWDNGTYCVIEATLSATVDALKRVHGSATYHVEGVTEYGRNFTLDSTANLEGLVRWP